MWEIIIVFVICILASLAASTSGYRTDRYLKKKKFFKRIPLRPGLKKILYFHNKQNRDAFLVYGIQLELYSYFAFIVSLAALITTLAANNGDVTFVCAVIMYAFTAFDTLIIIIEMTLLGLFAKNE